MGRSGPKAAGYRLSDGKIHDTAFIGSGVQVGRKVSVGPYAVVLGSCVSGDSSFFGPGAKIGSPPEIASLPQNAAWTHDIAHAGVVIGQGVVIRDNVVIHQGSHRATTIGDEAWLLNSCYLAHDVQVGPRATISAGVMVGGHVVIGPRVNIGMGASVHQRRVIGAGAMVGMGTPVTRDVPPFAKVYGTPARLHGVNHVGLQRSGVAELTIQTLKSRYESGDFNVRDLIDDVEWREQSADFRAWNEHSMSSAERPATPSASAEE